MLNNLISQEEHTQKEHIWAINLGVIYLGILAVLMAVVYFYGVYRNQNLAIYISFVKIWPLLLIAVGLSIFKVKGSFSLSAGFFVTVLAIGLTIGSVFVQAGSIKTQTNTFVENINNQNPISVDMSINSTDVEITKSINSYANIDYTSNYSTIKPNIYLDEDKVFNLDINQLLYSPGIGDYKNMLTIGTPSINPLLIDIDANISDINLNLSDLLAQSINMKLQGSRASISIGEIQPQSVMNIVTTASKVDIIIPSDIKVLLSTSSTFTVSNIVGLAKKSNESRVYESISVQSSQESLEIDEQPTLTINLNATFSQVNVTQK